ncbi:MAG: S1-like domain-containing RNA-binding protein [Bdellovibrionota bacterium]
MVAVLEVKEINRDEAWLSGESHTELLLPLEEQTHVLALRDKIVVFVTEDEHGPFASMKLDAFIMDSGGEFVDGQKVDLVIWSQTDLGYKAIVNGTHWGVIYSDEVFQPLKYGQRITGWIKKVREDRKLDLLLRDPANVGHKAAEEIGPLILEQLEKEKGFLPINDKTPAEEIYRRFGVSKKKFKIALGGLYKRRLIVIEENGIRSTKS